MSKESKINPEQTRVLYDAISEQHTKVNKVFDDIEKLKYEFDQGVELLQKDHVMNLEILKELCEGTCYHTYVDKDTKKIILSDKKAKIK